ncbi:MAG: glyoxalase/bleomycin resistance/extradiol dioxygenase family protein [Alphaproteobacteria bacterium HGW-Alphaproteobacteria-6]|nr:MAG: glyoxalase/bleomycin resistance/extradiol dioxygenase family protein [Alphaproteobacteria bacterium HGW-Alphaproteobacteria-6]
MTPAVPPPPDATLESALYASDLAAAEAFYGGVIGLGIITRQPGRHVFFRVGASVLLVFDPEATRRPPGPGASLPVPPHGGDGAGHYCFAVPEAELDGWRDHLTRAGIAIEADFRWPGGARSLYVRDPAGNSVEFADPALWS